MIKKFFLLSILLFICALSFSQNSNLVLFTEQGEPFYVVLNGIKQNGDARTNIKISDLTAPYYKCKIIFKNTELGQLDKNIQTKPGSEITYVIRKTNKDKWVIRWMNEAPISNSKTSFENNSYHLSTSEPQSDYTPANNTTQNSTKVTDHQNVSKDENLNVNVSDPVSDSKISIDLKMNKADLNTITPESSVIQSHRNKEDNAPNLNQNTNNQRQITNAVPGYNGPFGCNHPLNASSFEEVKTSIASKSFENSKLTIAKQVITNNCLITSQIKEIMKLFDFEASRLDIAKFAYGYTYDKGNYYQLNDAFDFESSITDLNNYIKNKKY